MATTGSAPSAGAVSGARTAYDMHSVSNNQESQTVRKYGNSGGAVRQRSTSNLRAPLSNTPSLRKSPNETQRSGAQRNGDNDGRSKNGFEGTNAKDLYKKQSTDDLQYDDIPENMYRPDKEDLAGWIHREKLAKIENEELQAAGINLAKARSKGRDSTSNRGRETPKDQRDNGSVIRDDRRVKTSSPVNEDPDEIDQDWDLRTPEEIASDNAAAQMYTTPLLRKSGSKIPVMTSSPTPIPSDRYERETPMPRKRTMSGSITPEDGLSIGKPRAGQDTEAGQTGSKTGTPTKQRSKSVSSRQPSISTDIKNMPTSRKPSISVKPGQTPASQSNRPTTRGNDTDRPRTAVNPPEGDPPWLATMYKPDPRLPPDQQLIPTLAKKQQQQMWEAQGQVPSTYDRNFAPLQIYGADGQPVAVDPESGTTKEKLDQSDAWPLKPMPTAKPATSPQRPSTSSGTGGYSTMPKVTDPPVPVAASPKVQTNSPAPARSQTPQGNQTTNSESVQGTTKAATSSRLQQQPLSAEQEEKLQKKGCCCIVM